MSSSNLPVSHSRSEASILRTGQLLAGRYRVLSFAGAGSLGEVYEARDLELGERLAVKILRPELAADEQALARFKREIQLARRVTHPNVCRTFDLVYHRNWPAGRDLAFLTMELLRGETLAQRLARCGRMSAADALPLIRQMTDALAAAHSAGVIHRDLKSSNVVLVREPYCERAVIADFGLARSQALAPGSAASLTGSGQLVGSPAYMAPEQIRCQAVGPATDVYALGVVLYEMVTGELPFVGETAFDTALKRLQEPPPPPRSKVPELERNWEAVILRCLEREPEARYQDPRKVTRELAAVGGTAPQASTSSVLARFRRKPTWRVAAMLALALGAGWVLPGHQEAAPRQSAAIRRLEPPPSPQRLRRAVAVLGFGNLSGRPEANYLGVSLLHMLPTELAATGELRLIPVDDVEQAIRDLALRRGTSLAPESLVRLRRRVAADLAVSGSYLVAVGGGEDRRTRFDLVVQDTRTLATVATLSLEGTESRFLATVARLGARLRAELGAGDLSAQARSAVRASLPSSLEAARLYAEGLSQLRRFEASEARRSFAEAAFVEPENPLIHGALASAWLQLGYQEKARAAAAEALAHVAVLSHRDRRWIEARYRELSHDWDAAVAIYQELFNYFPDDLEHGLRLAAAETAAGRGAAALATADKMRQLPEPAGSDPRIDLVAAQAAGALADFAGQRRAAQRALEQARDLGAGRIVAQAYLEEAAAFQGLGDNPRAAAALEQARRLFEERQDLKGVADALKQLGTLEKRQGRLGSARELYREALASYRRLGNRRGEAAVLSNLAIVCGEERDLAAANELYEQALVIMREIDYRRGEAVVLLNLGNVTMWQGDLARTAALTEEALVLLRQQGDRFAEATTLHNLGYVHWKRGDLAAAAEQFEAALELQEQLGSENYLTAATLHDLAGVHRDRGNPARARRSYEQALALRRRHGDGVRTAESLAALAALAIDEGRLERSADLIGEALEERGLESFPAVEAEVCRTLADSLLARGLLDEARSAIERARSRAAAAGDPWLEVPVAISAARIAAARGDAGREIAELRSALERARLAGFEGRLLEARLVLGEIEIAAGDRTAGRRILATVGAAARTSGFASIARRAEAAIS